MNTDLRFPGPIFEEGHFRPHFDFRVKAESALVERARSKDIEELDPFAYDRRNIYYGMCLAWGSTSAHIELTSQCFQYSGSPSGYLAVELLDAWDIVTITAMTNPSELVAMMRVDVSAGLWNVTKRELKLLQAWLEKAHQWEGARFEYDVEDGEWTEESLEQIPATSESRIWFAEYLNRLDEVTTVGFVGVRTEQECPLYCGIMDARHGDDQYLLFHTMKEIQSVFAPVIPLLVQWEELMHSVQQEPLSQ